MTQNVDAFVSKLCDILGYEWPRCHTILKHSQRQPTQLFLKMFDNLVTFRFQKLSFPFLFCHWYLGKCGSKTVSKIGCHTFLKQANIGSLRHVTHTKREIIAVHSNHLFWSKTRLHFGSFLAKVSRVVSASKSDASKTLLLTGRGYPPSFKKR